MRRRHLGGLALLLTAACGMPVPLPPPPPARPAPVAQAPASRPASRSAEAPLPAPDFSPLVEAIGDQLLAPGLTLPGALWVQPAPLAERLGALLLRRNRAVASSAAEAAAVVVLLSSAELDVLDGQRARTLSLLGLVVSSRTGELLAATGSRQTKRLGMPASAAAHPTAAELLDLANEVGQVLRQKLTQPGVAWPPRGVVVETRPVRGGAVQAIQAELAALFMLKAIIGVPRVRAVLGARQRGGLLPAGTVLVATHVLKAELSSSGGAGQESRLAIQLKAQLVPLIATNAPLVEADATLLPPLAPDAS
jgi:hypothetical protein